MIKTQLDVFERDIIFFFGDFNEVIKFAKKEKIYDEDAFNINPDYTQGRTLLTPKGYIICWIKHKTSHKHIAHEIFHCVDFALRGAGISLTDASDEVYAYSIQCLTEQLYSKIKKIGLKQLKK